MEQCTCGNECREGQRNCTECNAESSRKWRKENTLTAEQRKKDNCRSYAGVYKRRGKLIQLPCEECGEEDSEMHHKDYDKPLEVTWLCRRCRLNKQHNENQPAINVYA